MCLYISITYLPAAHAEEGVGEARHREETPHQERRPKQVCIPLRDLTRIVYLGSAGGPG